MLTLVKQPPKSELCGHCCLAMITGLPLNTITAYIGHWTAISIGEILTLLRKLNIKCRSYIYRGYLPPRCIVFIRQPNRGIVGHLVVLWDGKWYDPHPKVTTIFDSDIKYFVEIHK